MKYVFERYEPTSAPITGVRIETECGEIKSELILRISDEQYSEAERIREEIRKYKPKTARVAVHAGSESDVRSDFMRNIRDVEKTCGARFCAEKLREFLTSPGSEGQSLVKTNGARVTGVSSDLNTIKLSLAFKPEAEKATVDDYRNALNKTCTILQGVVYHSPETAGLFNRLSFEEITKSRDVLHMRLNEDMTPKPKKGLGAFFKRLGL